MSIISRMDQAEETIYKLKTETFKLSSQRRTRKKKMKMSERNLPDLLEYDQKKQFI